MDSLGTRLASLLTLALLPLGLIAVVQTYRVMGETSARVESALLGETLLVTRPERSSIQAGIGRAETAAAAVDTLLDDAAACSAYLRDLVEESEAMFAGVIPQSGLVECASEGAPLNMADTVHYREVFASPGVSVRVTDRGRVTGRPATLISAPIEEEGELLAYVTLSFPHKRFYTDVRTNSGFQPLEIVTFNSAGDLLTTASSREEALELLPQNRSLKALTGTSSTVFRDTDSRGEGQIYAVAPLVEGTVSAMAIWPEAQVPSNHWLRWTIPTVILPALMWITSLSVAYFAVHRLVIRHIRRLRQRMRLFSRFRRVEEHREDETLPLELREVSESFVTMAHTIQREEAELENSLREKDALLREVYHRVRNNLQLIASMNNMQMRASRSPEAQYALKRLQDRIMALSTIHATLYEAPALAKVRADEMVLSLARQVASKADTKARIELRATAEPLLLYPDQAVPLSLLVVEAVTNAVKHLGSPEETQPPYIDVALEEAEGEVHLRVDNSVTQRGDLIDGQIPEGKLGMQLMNAFVVQLGATMEITERPDRYRLDVRFSVSDYGEETSIF
ncbi:sensor histidine kinase [Roseitranquillus sediminis]|uniref:sensor histidine kinase n=1 Tax=Roseitranquillus sediminis TaxID=2809051 RepID=UPI001D0CBC9C|nr:sensor histidine kinase [Roseitranquillus sediminis]MBM9596204.1 sensor histidine kinase [Roseitranquillus sediminis]